jgi:hypothetical protein
MLAVVHQLWFSTTLRHVKDDLNPSTIQPDGPALPTGTAGLRDRFWFQALAVLVILATIVLLVLRLGHREVVQDWQLIATCPAEAGTAPSTVSTTLDTSDCATTPSRSVSGRGWPIVPFVLPAAAGLDPAITAVRSDDRARTLRLEYKDAGSVAATTTAEGVVLAFVEVPPNDIPPAPYTIEGASGPVTVTSAPTS